MEISCGFLLNIYGSQKKGWLPYGYGRKKYEEFTEEEQEVIESFEGQESYNESVMSSDYYLGTKFPLALP